MRLLRHASRFILLAVIAAAVAVPVAAFGVTAPEGLRANPSRQPVFHRSQSSGAVIGTLRIPAIGIDETIRSGVSLSVIDQGVAHWAGTVGPGGDGNMVLAGHRTTFSRPFEDIDRLEVGDLIYLEDGSGFDIMYRVTDSFVVDPRAMWITYDKDEPSLTLFACHPKGSARYRLVINAELVAGRPIA